MLVTGTNAFLRGHISKAARGKQYYSDSRIFYLIFRTEIRGRQLVHFNSGQYFIDTRPLFFANFHPAHQRGQCFVSGTGWQIQKAARSNQRLPRIGNFQTVGKQFYSRSN